MDSICAHHANHAHKLSGDEVVLTLERLQKEVICSNEIANFLLPQLGGTHTFIGLDGVGSKTITIPSAPVSVLDQSNQKQAIDATKSPTIANLPVFDERGSVYLLTLRHKLPLAPQPKICLQSRWHPAGYCIEPNVPATSELGPLIFVLLDWRLDPSDMLIQRQPTTLYELLKGNNCQSLWQYPSHSQLLTLVCHVARSIDILPKMSFFCPSLDSIYILNPSDSGKPNSVFEYRFCPYSLYLDNAQERPADANKLHIVATFFDKLCHHLATDRAVGMNQQASSSFPGLLQIRNDLLAWRNNDVGQSLCDLSSIKVLNQVLSTHHAIEQKKSTSFMLSDIPILLEVLQCSDRPQVMNKAAKAIEKLLSTTTDDHVAMHKALKLVALHIECVMPKGDSQLLQAQGFKRNSTWVVRMEIIQRVLSELERCKYYNLIKMCQQRLVSNGFDRCVSSDIYGGNAKQISRRIYMAFCKATIMISMHFPTMRMRHLTEQNVQKMAQQMIRASRGSKPVMDTQEAAKYIGMMMVMSDFWEWDSVVHANLPGHAKHKHLNDQMRDIWNEMEEATFLLHVLPCWDQYLSSACGAVLAQKMQDCCISTVNAMKHSRDNNCPSLGQLQKKLSFILSWMVNLAWIGPMQATFASFCELHSHFVSAIFCNMRPFPPIRTPSQLLLQQHHYDAVVATETVSKSEWDLPQWNVPLDMLNTLIESKNDTEDYPVWHHYMPAPDGFGAPSIQDSVYLDIPNEAKDVLEYGSVTFDTDEVSNEVPLLRSTFAQIRSRAAVAKYRPVTCVTRHMLCHTKDDNDLEGSKVVGTTGMFKVVVTDGGRDNQMTLGITWNLEDEHDSYAANLVPGHSATSLGLDISTGCIQYQNREGKLVNIYQICHVMGSGSHISIGIANRLVYFVVDGFFYPPVPRLNDDGTAGFFMLPSNCRVHGLVRLSGPEATITTHCMTKHWGDGKLHKSLSRTNPVSFGLKLAWLRSRTCPHSYAQKRPSESRPRVPECLKIHGVDYETLLDESQKLLVQRIELSHQSCEHQDCTCRVMMQDEIDKIIWKTKSGNYSMGVAAEGQINCIQI